MPNAPPTYDQVISQLNNDVVRLRMGRENVNSGELHASLIWNDIADLDLHVITPSMEHMYFGHKESRCGGWLDVDMNAGNYSLEPIENIFWASSPSGKYQFYVHNFRNRTDTKTVFVDPNRKVPFRVKLIRNGEESWFSGSVGSGEKIICFEFEHTGSGAVGSFIVLPERDVKSTFKEHCQVNNVTYNVGTGYYALVKKEKVSNKKDLLLHNKASDTFTIGRDDVLTKMSLSTTDNHEIKPEMIPENCTLFVQSTSHNRAIAPGTKVLVNVGVREALRFRMNDRYNFA